MTKLGLLSGLGLLLALGPAVWAIDAAPRESARPSEPHRYPGHPVDIHASPHGGDGEGEPSFVARHLRRQAVLNLNGPIERVWPLFDPIHESLWAPAWQPEILHPTDGTVGEGMVLRTHGMEGDPGELVWTVARYEPAEHHITYSVVGRERTFTVDVQCAERGESTTEASVTYQFVGLTALGNEIGERSAEHLFRFELKDWQTAIDQYLETGTAARHP